MSNSNDGTVSILTPYIRLTVDNGSYTLWVIVPIPSNYTVNGSPSVVTSGDTVQVSISINGSNPSSSWNAEAFSIALPAPTPGVTNVNTTVFLDDPENEGSSVIKYDEAEQE